MKINITKIVSITIIVILLLLSIIWTYNSESKSLKYCRNLQNYGYEDYQDIATHKDCRLNNDSLAWSFKLIDDVYNSSCRLEKPLIEDYGKNCVWGGLGWIRLIIKIGLITMLISILTMIISSKQVESK